MRVSLLKASNDGIMGLQMITFVEPLGLECVAGALEQEGHVCQIVDFRLEEQEDGFARLRRFGPDIVGLQCGFTTERFRVVYFAQRVKRELPDALVVVGGHDASRDPEWFMQQGIDVVALGDGEEVVPGLVRAWQKGGDLKSAPGLVLHRADGPVYTGPAPARRPLDELPLPARHLVARYSGEYYMNFRRPLALVETARGCPFKCNFCSVWKFHESSFREKSAQRVVEELAQVDAPHVFFTDDIFWMNVKRARELARAIQASGIRKHFNIQTRTDIVCRFPELIEIWKECGKLTVFLGLEKIDDKGLKHVNKSNSAANNNRAVEIVQQAGVGYAPNFIVDPDWDYEDFDKLKRWIDRTGAYGAAFAILTPLPGTDLWDDLKDAVTTDDWELYDLAHTVLPTKLPLDEFYQQYAGLWQHALDVRYKIHGRVRTQLDILAALATRRVTVTAMRRGMRMGKFLSRSKSFLKGHSESPARMAEVSQFLTPTTGAPAQA